jgi:hypothetical protein
MPVIWSTAGSEVDVRVMVPEALIPLPVMVKVPTVVPANRVAPKRRAPIQNMVLIKLPVVYAKRP